MNPTSFIRVVEVWVPDDVGSLLVLGGAHYGAAKRFGASSSEMCFGKGEGLPGQAWEAGRPIVLKEFQGSYFRRTAAALADGLTCGIALPVFSADVLKAVVLIFCGGSTAAVEDLGQQQVGAIELWRNDAKASKDMVLDDGVYGATSEVFEHISRRTAFRKGTGLPGMAWESGLPVFMADLGKGGRFLRADSALQVGINRGFAIPCNTPGPDAYVMAFLSALATPIVQRFESWVPTTAAGGTLMRQDGFCERDGALAAFGSEAPLAVRRALATGTPQTQATGNDGFQAVVALPVLRAAQTTRTDYSADGANTASVAAVAAVVAVVAWYL